MSKPHNGYDQAVNWLFEQFPSYQVIGSKAYKPTLDNIRILLNFLGNPQDDLAFIHVAGSNGKGSTCSMLASILTESNYKVGLFTSPHIQDYSERIRIDGNPIDQEAVVRFVAKVRSKDLSFSPSFFEMTFALAILHFKNEACDICVIETGLGGRLDATNVISPLLSVITTISLEHTDILGDTLEEIAKEKAGIIKLDTPVVIGAMSASIRTVFTEIAKDKNAQLIDLDDKVSIPENFPLLGDYQRLNYRLACTVLRNLEGFPIKVRALETGIENISANSGFKGRLQIIDRAPLTLLDVSHNPDGIKATLETVMKLNRGELYVILGTSSDKDLLGILLEFPATLKMCFTEFSNQRSATVDEFTEILPGDRELFGSFHDPLEALKFVQNSATQDDTILIIGSFFLVSDYF
ncbi:MAG: dihydrofolate synthase/folylpolyglutamate synthase [Flavobacteriaceae bacterium]